MGLERTDGWTSVRDADADLDVNCNGGCVNVCLKGVNRSERKHDWSSGESGCNDDGNKGDKGDNAGDKEGDNSNDGPGIGGKIEWDPEVGTEAELRWT